MNTANKEIIKYLQDYFKVDSSEVTVIKQLLGGMSNKVYLVEVNNEKYTIRIPGKEANKFVDRNHEYQAIKTVEELNLTNETIHFDLKTGIKISKYVDGTVLTEVDINNYLTEICAILKRMHTSNLTLPFTYNMVDRLNRYESYNEKINPLYIELKTKWLELFYEKYASDSLVLCHGDAQRSNIVTDNERLYLFDFEYAAMNSVYYDIASFGNVSFLDSIQLLSTYLERKPTDKELDKLRFYRLFQVLQWHQVALYKAKIGLGNDLNLDFELLASKYLNIAKQLYQDIKEK